MEMDTEIRNPKRNMNGSIDVELFHPIYGWVPFTASDKDIELHGRVIYKSIIEGRFGPIAEAE